MGRFHSAIILILSSVMLTGEPLAFRPGGSEDGLAPSPPLGPAPRPLEVPSQERLGARVLRLVAGTTASVAAHVVLAIMFLAIWRSMVPDVNAPEPIAVEIVHAVPGEAPKPAPQSEPPPPPPPPPAPAAKADPAPPAPKAPVPPPSVLDQALPSPLVEPPPEPKAAASQSEVNQTGHAAPVPGATKETAAGVPTAAPTETPSPAPAMPEVITAGDSDTAVPAPSATKEQGKPPAQGDTTPSTANATAALSAALATSSMPMPMSFRAALSARGSSSDANYRGSVFGALSRAREAVSDEARAKHLKGQVVMAIELGETGAIEKIAIVQSSGHPDADAFAMAMVRRAAPFPPPPPGASHQFTPAIAFGEN